MFKIIAQKEGLDFSAEALSEGIVTLEKKLSKISMDEEDANDPLVSQNLASLMARVIQTLLTRYIN